MHNSVILIAFTQKPKSPNLEVYTSTARLNLCEWMILFDLTRGDSY